jgi:SAM-dependent methyltransferase
MAKENTFDRTKFACIQCNSSSASPFLLECEDYYLQKPYRANYSRCNSCGLIQQSPIPADVASFYDAYPIHQKKSLLHRLMRQWVMSACYFHTNKLLADSKASALLIDFGCGDGWFLEASRNANLQLVGFEVDKAHAAHLEKILKLPIYSDEQTLLHDLEGKADVVTMHFVLEHLTDINRAFETVQRLLKPGGVFYFIIPNISSWEMRLFGKKWHNLDAPRHISFLEERAIRQLTERWGFEITAYRGVPFPNGVAGSIPVVLTGNFKFSIFLLFLPLGILLSRMFPSGTAAYWLTRQTSIKQEVKT